MGHPFKTLLFHTCSTIKNNFKKNKHILTTTKVGFLSRVLFKQVGRTCLLIGSDQPKVVLPYLFGMCGLINSGMIINVNCIIVDTIPNFSQS